MELAFLDKTIRNICEDEDSAIEAFGDKAAQALQTRISDLRSSRYAHDALAGRKYTEDPAGMIVTKAGKHLEISFCANEKELPLIDNKHANWKMVRRIKITAIRRSNP